MNGNYTYFGVIYNENDFDLEEFKEKLNLSDFKVEDYASRLNEDNKRFKIEIGCCDRFNVDVNVMIRETLKELFGKEQILSDLKKEYNLEYYLERVIHLDCDKVQPILSLDSDIIKFLYEADVVDDLDYYV